MIKKLLRTALICLLLCQFLTKASAQTTTQHYAVSGTAGINLIHSVYWLTWGGGAGTVFPSNPNGQPFNSFDITEGTYIWNYSPTTRITAVVSNVVTNTAHEENLAAYTPGTYFGDTNTGEIGDGLNILYSGNGLASGPDPVNPNQNANKGVPQSGISITSGTATFDISIIVEILVGSTWTQVNYPGMVIGDAESIDPTEYISGHTDGTEGWQLLNARKQDAASDANYVMDFSTGGSSSIQGSDFKLHTINNAGNVGVQAVMFAHGVHSITNLSMYGSGTTAMAIGFVLPFDLGDAPVNFGNPNAYINNFIIQPHLPTNGTFAVGTYAQTTLVPKANVFIGAQNVDADGEPLNSALADQDDKTNLADEDGIPTTNSIANGVNLKVNQQGDVILNIKAANLVPDIVTSTSATLYGWLDFNSDGVFSANEMVSVPVPAGTSQGTNFVLTFPNASFTNNIKTGPLFGRFRITTTDLSTTDDVATTVDERSTTATLDGEIEDYKFNDIVGISIAGTVVDDANGSADGQIASTVAGQNGIQLVAGQQLYAYLLSTDITPVVIAKSIVAADGTYSFTNQNNGNYTVVISTKNQQIGDAQSTVVANLPPTYVPSGSSFGTNNAAGTGISTGTPSMQIRANTPGNSLDISGLNFGVNQVPLTVADAGTASSTTPVNINVTANDSDPDGTLDLTSVLLTNPADNTTNNTTVTIANKGTFTVNTTNGIVTFTPLAGFAGTVTIPYTIKDNLGTTSLPAVITVTAKPAGVDDAATTNIQTPVTINVKANDGTNANGTTVIIAGNTAANGQPANGAVVVNPDNSITYTPVATFIGTDTYTYELQSADGTLKSDPITVTITVLPSGQPDAAQTLTSTPVTIPIEVNDGVASTGNGTATIAVTHPANGVATVSGNNVIYTPVSVFSGTDTFTYTLTTNGLTSNPILVTVTVLSANPSIALTKVATNKVTAVGEVINYTITAKNTSNVVLTNVVLTDIGATNISPASVATLAIGATVTFTAQHTVTQAEFDAGTYSNQASITADDPNGNPIPNTVSDDPSTPAPNDPTVSLIVPPGQVSLTKTGVYNNATSIVYTFTVKNTGTVKLTNVTITDPTLNITNAPVTIPAGGLLAGQSATFNATYTITQADRLAGSKANTATVNSIDPSGDNTTAQGNTTTVLPALPVANNDVAVTQLNTPTSVPVLTNDTPDNSPFDLSTVTVVTGPAHGTTTVNPDGTITYTPTNGYSGPDTFTYNVKDQNGYTSNTATVNLSVNNFVASMTLTKVANNGAGNVGDVINYTIIATNTGTATLTNVTVTDVNADAGSISPAVITTLAAGASATITAKHTVTLADVTAGSVSNQANVTAKDPNGNPVTGPPSDDPNTPAVNDPTVTAVTPGTGAVTLTKTGVFDGNTITYTFTIKNTGTVTLTNVTLTDANVGLLNTVVAASLAAGATTTYTANYTLRQADKDAGTVINNATISSKDPNGNSVTANGTVTIPVTKSPTATADATTTGIGQPVIIPVLSNDNSGNTTFNIASIQIVTQPAHGTAVANADGSVTYTPVAGYTGSDSFTYKVADSYGYFTNVAPVTITISAPGSISLTKTGVYSNTTITYTFTVKNTGPVVLTAVTITDAKVGLTAAAVTIPLGGLAPGATATLTATYTVTQVDKDLGTVTNTATVSGNDPVGNVVTGTATVTTTIPKSPVAADETATTLPGQPVIIPVVKDGTPGDAPLDPTSVQIVTQPQHGTVKVNPDGTITYTPNAGYTGPDSFTYRMKDTNGYFTNIATVTISVVPTVDLKIPTLFTPNGDGANDTFEIRGLSKYPNNELIIVNRWGNEVFKQTNYQNKWAGEGLNEGTYYYLLYIKNVDGSIFQVLKGWTTLLRSTNK